MSKKICKTCSCRYHDNFCMVNCLYVNDEHTCKRWTSQPMQFNYHVIYRLCKDYINLCEDYKERERLKEELTKEDILKLDLLNKEYKRLM